MLDIVFSDKKRITPCSIHINDRELFDTLDKNVVCIGSCFAEAIANHLSDLGINTYYELKSCYRFSAKSLADYLHWVGREKATNSDLITQNFYFSSDNQLVRSLRHTDLFDSADNYEYLKSKCDEIDKRFVEKMRQADLVIVTLGTNRYLRHIDTGTVITNVGGITNNKREVIDPTTEETKQDVQSIIENVSKLAPPGTPLMFTVSPQRYGWAPIGNYMDDREVRTSDKFTVSHDGIVANSYDKAKLRVCLQDCLESSSNNDKDLMYFPSFEMVLDELRHLDNFGRRDKDFGHVSRDTSAYVINRFANAYLNKDIQHFYVKYKANIKLIGNMRFESAEEFEKVISSHLELLKDNAKYGIPASLLELIASTIEKFPIKLSSLQNKLQEVRQVLTDTKVQSRNDLVAQLYKNVDAIEPDRKVLIYGTGDTAIDVLKNTRILEGNVLAFVGKASNEKDFFFGKPLVNPAKLHEMSFDNIIVAAIESREDITTMLKSLDIDIAKVVTC